MSNTIGPPSTTRLHSRSPSPPRLLARQTSELDSIAVVVRVRPLLAHEVKRRSRKIASVTPDCRSIRLNISTGRTNVQQVSGRQSADHVKHYRFQYCAPPEISQETFFEQCGVTRLLDFSLDGFASTVFAYGQTGSGKTYSIAGSEATAANVDSGGPVQTTDGVIPRAIEYLFAKIEERKAEVASEHGDRLEFVVHTSFYEIYNEMVFDLLAKEDSAPHGKEHLDMTFSNNPNLLSAELAQKKALSLRYDEASKGFSVQGLTTKKCTGKAQVLRAFARGFLNRRRGSHKLNEDSSRSHAIMTLNIEVTTTTQLGTTTHTFHDHSLKKYGKMVFVDLAGSERLKDTGVSDGQLLKEATNINRSLFTLGKVISALDKVGKAEADQDAAPEPTGFESMAATVINTFPHGSPHTQQPVSHVASLRTDRTGLRGASRLSGPPASTHKSLHIPYRDSKLTMLLMDSLGGSARTLMITCISPAEEWSDESFSTLNYAMRAKNIVNKPAVRMDKSEQLLIKLYAEIRALQQENQELKESLSENKTASSNGSSNNSSRGAVDPPISASDDGHFDWPQTQYQQVSEAGQGQGKMPFGPAVAEEVTPPQQQQKRDIMVDDFHMVADFNAHMQDLRSSLMAVAKEKDSLARENETLKKENDALRAKLRTAEESFFGYGNDLLQCQSQPHKRNQGLKQRGQPNRGTEDDVLSLRIQLLEANDKMEYLEHRERQLMKQVQHLKASQ